MYSILKMTKNLLLFEHFDKRVRIVDNIAGWFCFELGEKAFNFCDNRPGLVFLRLGRFLVGLSQIVSEEFLQISQLLVNLINVLLLIQGFPFYFLFQKIQLVHLNLKNFVEFCILTGKIVAWR